MIYRPVLPSWRLKALAKSTDKIKFSFMAIFNPAPALMWSPSLAEKKSSYSTPEAAVRARNSVSERFHSTGSVMYPRSNSGLIPI